MARVPLVCGWWVGCEVGGLWVGGGWMVKVEDFGAGIWVRTLGQGFGAE